MRTTIAAAITAGSILALAAPAAAHATTSHTPTCADASVEDHINKTDNGHGTPSEWADLRLDRYTGIQCTSPGHYKVLITDDGTLRTRAGAGTPNGSGGQITRVVPGRVEGAYGLTVVGELAIPKHRDTSLSSTAYVTSLFAEGATVTGGDYAWTYTTRCEKWVDSSKNDDGQGAAAGNITGKRCPKPTPTPSGSPTTPAGGGTPTSSPTTVPVGAPQTGDGTSSGDHGGAMIAGGVVLVVLGAVAGVALALRRRGQHH